MPKILRARKKVYLITVASKFNSEIHHLKGTFYGKINSPDKRSSNLGLVENRAIDNNMI